MEQKRCSKCGTVINANSNYCSKCGGQNFTSLKAKKKRKILPIVCIMIGIVLFIGFVGVLLEDVNSNIELDDTNNVETVNFDLSQYDSYGNLSCGRIWVTKSFSDWDTSPTKYYAYLDTDGNVIYDWKPVEEFYHIGDYVDANRPQDFKDGRAMIIHAAFGNDDLTNRITLIDVNGNVLYEDIYVRYSETPNRAVAERKYWITDFDDEGYAYFVGGGVYWLDNKGVHLFDYNLPDTSSVIHSIERLGNYFYVNIGVYSILFDSSGSPLIDFGKTAGIYPNSIEIINNKYIEAVFEGKDDKTYVCVIDFNGNFIKSPVLKSEYVRNEEDLAKVDVNSFVGTWVYETASFRKDTLIISEKDINWETVWSNGNIESSTMYYNDLEFYDSYSKFPYEFKNGEITVTLIDGSKITFKRK